MPVIQAFSIPSAQNLPQEGISQDILDVVDDHDVLFLRYMGTFAAYTITRNAAADAPSRVLSSGRSLSYFDDLYNRIHLTPSLLGLGNVLGDQTHDVTLWNAYTVSKSLPSIVVSGADGISISGLSAPSVIPANKETTITVAVSLAGPAVINASYTFVFDTESPVLYITGGRVVVFGHRPDWSVPVVERLSWLTDVLLAHSGDEQRVRLREHPRKMLSYSLLSEDKYQSALLESTLFGWQSRMWGVPLWMDRQILAAEVPSGSTTIPCTTDGFEFSVGGLVLLWASYNQYEVVEVLSVGASSLTLNLGTVSTWGAGTHLYPLKLGRLNSRQQFLRETNHHLVGTVEFNLVDNTAISAVDSSTTYLGVPVYLGRLNWVEPLDLEFVRQLEELDYSTGRKWVDDLSGFGTTIKKWRWALQSRSEVLEFKAWLEARAGRLTPFWSLTQGDDLELLSGISAGSVSISVRNIGYSKYLIGDRARKHIVIRAINGTLYFREIVSGVEADVTAETLTMDSELGVSLGLEAIDYVRFIGLTRLEGDSVDIEWHTTEVAESSTMLRSLPS